MDFSTTQMQALTGLCDTFVPSVRPPAVEMEDPTGFWARRASDRDVPTQLAEELHQRLDEDEFAATAKLLDALHLARFSKLPQTARELLLAGLAATGDEAREGIAGLRALTLYLFYGSVDADGSNPNWSQSRYPGPPPSTSTAPALTTAAPTEDRIEWTAEVVVVGSGSGGGVIAGELAAAGVDVVVLEAGTAFADDEFPPDEHRALTQMYWRRGLTPTHDGTVAILAGATLGGGSTINWQNCVRPPAGVRAEWADDHGLEGLDGELFDRHLDAVSERLGATADGSVTNGPNARLAEGAAELGASWHAAQRNVGPADDPVSAGHVGFGDRSGVKQGTIKTWLADAVAAGTRILTGCTVDRVLTTDGRAVGVVGRLADGREVEVRAADVVVAAGALETPAVLLRSRIGGPAVGRHLRLHPVPMLVGVYAESQQGWWGPPQATIIDEWTDVAAGHGYLVETAHFHPGVTAMSVPWRSGRDHKLMMGRSGDMAAFIAVQRDHGGGHVVLDERGRAEVHYPWQDAIDASVTAHALRSMAELHAAAGARTILDLHPDRAVWRRGDDLDAFASAAAERPIGPGERVLFSAHQMGSARMGVDPRASVAGPDGQLHDTPGVWIGDTSVFPTAVGSNPMLTCMAMARRTAHAMLAQR